MLLFYTVYVYVLCNKICNIVYILKHFDTYAPRVVKEKVNLLYLNLLYLCWELFLNILSSYLWCMNFMLLNHTFSVCHCLSIRSFDSPPFYSLEGQIFKNAFLTFIYLIQGVYILIAHGKIIDSLCKNIPI